jgi:hypothetical protein
MVLFFLPPVVQALIGVVGLVFGLALHSVIIAAVGVVGIGVGGARWMRSRRNGGSRS